jgi:lipopolysaccharide transport protein LptA
MIAPHLRTEASPESSAWPRATISKDANRLKNLRYATRSGVIDSRLWALIATNLFFSCVLPTDSVFGQTIQTKNFQIAEFYEPPRQKQMKFLLKGARAEQRGKGEVWFTQPQWQTFRQTGESELLMQAPECLYDSSSRSISSAGPLQFRTTDGKFFLGGEGFLWRQTNSNLTISNRIHTIIHPDLFNTANTNRSLAAGAAQREIEIFSDRFNYEAGSGLGVYNGQVRVVGTNLVLTAGTLSFQLPVRERELQSLNATTDVKMDYEDIHASGQKAVYTADKDAIQLTGDPAWRTGAQEGRGDELFLDRTNQVLRVTGHAFLKMQGQSLERSVLASADGSTTNRAPATNQFLEVTCDKYEIRTNSAGFHDQVQVTEKVGDESRGKMNCGTLNVTFSGSNQLQRLVALDQVVIQQGEQRFRAGQAIYDATNSTLDLLQDPSWTAGPRNGNGQRISLAHGEEMVVRGQASMRLPARELARPTAGATIAMATNNPGAEQFAQIFSDEYTLRRDSARFFGKVRVVHPQMAWQCEALTVHFTTNSQVDQILGENSVAFTLFDDKGQKINGTGQKAVYSYAVTPTSTNDLVELSGDPVLTTTNGTFKNDVIILDRAHNRLLAPGNYKISAPLTPGGTNRFVLPKVKLTK